MERELEYSSNFNRSISNVENPPLSRQDKVLPKSTDKLYD